MAFESNSKERLTLNIRGMVVPVCVGDRLVARGPHRLTGKPDIAGFIVSVDEKTKTVMVQEKKYKRRKHTTTSISLSSGWCSLSINGVEIV